MRDITTPPKPSFSKKNIPDDLPEEAKKLYEKHANKAVTKKAPSKKVEKVESEPTSRRFTGSQIPVTTVHVPKQTMPEAIEKRPLFAVIDNATVSKKKSVRTKPSKTAMILGSKETKIALVILGVVLLTAGIAGFIFLPHATIAINIQTAPLLVDQKITLASNTASAPNTVPGSVFSQQVQVQGSSPVTHTEIIGTKAKGTVRLYNKTFDVQKIKEKSRLASKDGQIFYMEGPAIIPASSASSLASVLVQVEAGESGEQGNLTPQRLDFAALDKSAQQLVYGQVETAFTGGSGLEVKTVADTDINQAKDMAKSQARQQVEQSAKAQLQAGWSLMDESWDVRVSNITTVQKVGDKAEVIVYTATATARVLAYQEGALQTILQNALNTNLPVNSSLFPGALSFTKSVDSVDWDKQSANITARVTHTTIPNISIDTLQDKLVGRAKDDAISYLQNLPGVQSANVTLWPFWVQSIPSIQQRINIQINPTR